MIYREDFPRRLRRLRQRKGYSQEVLAGLSGITRGTVARYESGDMEPSMSALVSMADVLGVSTDYLSCRLQGETYKVNKKIIYKM